MATPGDSLSERLRALSARVGVVAAAFAVFLCGWLAMRSTDWKQMVLFSALALAAGAVASAFGRRAR
jgi:hypothetical protein